MAAISAKRARRWRCNRDRSARAERSFGTFFGALRGNRYHVEEVGHPPGSLRGRKGRQERAVVEKQHPHQACRGVPSARLRRAATLACHIRNVGVTPSSIPSAERDNASTSRLSITPSNDNDGKQAKARGRCLDTWDRRQKQNPDTEQ
jgi:hypothetical protein